MILDKWDHLKYFNAEICHKSIQSNSRPLSSLSFADLNRDISFSFDEGFENDKSKSPKSLNTSLILSESSKNGKFSEKELSDHLERMIKREKESLKTIESKITKVKAETTKEYHSLQVTLDGIQKLKNKIQGQNERYKSKCSFYEDLIKGNINTI